MQCGLTALVSTAELTMAQTIRKIYLHWSATDYNWAVPGYYHTIVQGNGTIRRLTGYDQPLDGHTYARNNDSVGLCLACMGGQGWSNFPPTEAQIESLCKEVANLALDLGWQADDITLQRVLTHAEAAANRDYSLEIVRMVSGWLSPTSTPQENEYTYRARVLGLPHENYGPSSWFDGWPGGFVDRWDLWQLQPSDRPGEGGFILRDKIKQYVQQASQVSVGMSSGLNPLRDCEILVGDRPISTGKLLADRRCYVKLADLARAYGMSAVWNNAHRYANLKTRQFTAKYLVDSPLVLGYPAAPIYLNRPEDAQGQPTSDPKFPVQPFINGIFIDNSLYVILADFCQELSISIRVDPDFSIHLGELTSPAATNATTSGSSQSQPRIVAESLPNKLRDCDVYISTQLVSKAYLLADRRCYVKLANLAAIYQFKLSWNNPHRYINVRSDRFQVKYRPDSALLAGYPVIPLYFNRPEDAKGAPIDPPGSPAQPFLKGILINNSLFVLIADFCQELGISIRVDPDFSIHLGELAG